MSPITIERVSSDGLTIETWRFCVIDTQIILDDYTKVIRPSRRHKGTATGHYNRLSARENTLDEADVPWDEALASEALLLHMKRMKVGRWKTDFGR